MPVRHGVLLYGPKGTGKSLLAEAIVSKLELNCVRIGPADVCSRYVCFPMFDNEWHIYDGKKSFFS